jgi:hypothetical protein
MAEKPTASQLNRLGERLRKGQANYDDIRALNDFRESFRAAFERVVGGTRISGAGSWRKTS